MVGLYSCVNNQSFSKREGLLWWMLPSTAVLHSKQPQRSRLGAGASSNVRHKNCTFSSSGQDWIVHRQPVVHVLLYVQWPVLHGELCALTP